MVSSMDGKAFRSLIVCSVPYLASVSGYQVSSTKSRSGSKRRGMAQSTSSIGLVRERSRTHLVCDGLASA